MILRSTYLIILLCLNNFLAAKPVEYQEDAYSQQAPTQIVERVEQVAQLMNFTQPYEVVVPKKAGVEINPWNRYICHGINPQTQRPLIVVNPELIDQLSQDEQTFLFAHCFGIFQEQGSLAAVVTKIIPYAHSALSLLSIAGLYTAINSSQILNNSWLSAIVAYSCVTGLNLSLLNEATTKFIAYMGTCRDVTICNKVIGLTGNRDAAISALMHCDQAIKKEAAQGDPFWQPFINTFEVLVQKLQDAQ